MNHFLQHWVTNCVMMLAYSDNVIMYAIFIPIIICIAIGVVLGLIMCLIHMCIGFTRTCVESNYCNICGILWRRRNYLQYEQIIEENLNNYQ